VNKIVTLCRLDWRRKWLILEALVLPLVIWTAIRTWGVSRTMRFLRRWAVSVSRLTPASAAPAALIDSARQAQSIVLKHTGLGGTCLVRALTLWALLLQSRLESEILVGLRKRDGKIEGHAWVEYGGHPINEDPGVIGTYTEFADALSFDRIT
jgi:hypothetical protein